MRTARLKEAGAAFYHIISRIVDRRFILNTEEKERYRILMRQLAGFCGVNILTYTFMSNHFHILVFIPERRPVDDEELLQRMGLIYDSQLVKGYREQLRMLRQSGQDEAAEALKARFTYRMYDISEFMKTLKQRFSQSYNRRHKRKGTLWEERYRSTLVEGSRNCLATVGAYIDLNAVRAGIVQDPKDYRFSGYAEAVAGSKDARAGIEYIIAGHLPEKTDWTEAAELYRQLLYVKGEVSGMDAKGQPIRKGFSTEQVQQVLDTGGSLSLNQLLRCKVRYFSNGAVLGCKRYVDDAIRRHNLYFRPQRKTGASPIKYTAELYTARRLRLNPIMLSSTG